MNFITINKFVDYSSLKDDKKRIEHFVSLYGVLCEYMGANMIPNSAELLGIYGRVMLMLITLKYM